MNTAKSSRISTIVPPVVGFPQPVGGLPWPSSNGGFARHHRPWSNTADRTPQWVVEFVGVLLPQCGRG